MPSQYKLAYFVSHPIQYQAPLLKLLAVQQDIDLHVFFLVDPSAHNCTDEGFNLKIEWDIPLLDGYKTTFLDSTLKNGGYSLTNPSVRLKSVNHALKSAEWDAVWVHGYSNLSLLYVIYHCIKTKLPLMFRGESTLLCSPQRPMKSFFLKWLIKNCTGLLWIGEDNRDYYRHYGARESQLFFTPYAVDNDFFQSSYSQEKNERKKHERCVFLFASKFIARKNAPLLLEAFAQLEKSIRDKAELWLVGDGDERPILEKRINELQLSDQVLLKGFKNQSELPPLIAQCDVFVLPSEKEPYGLIINEVMNLAKPVITTDEVGAARDLVKHKENGWVIPANCLTALSGALEEAIINRHKLAEMGKLSLEKINQWSFIEDIEGIRAALSSIKRS